MPEKSQIKARDYTPKILVENGVNDLPMLITQNHVKSIVYAKNEAMKLGIGKKNTNYHGLGKELLIKAIDGMDDPAAIYKKGANDYLIITRIKDASGNDIIVPVRIDGKGVYNNIYIDEKQIKSVYGKKNLNDYIEKNSFEKIYEKERNTLNPEVQYPDISGSLFNKSIPEPTAKSNKKEISLKDSNSILDVKDYIIGNSLSTGSNLKKDELLATLKKTSQNLYGETGNKYLQEIPKASVIPAAAQQQPQPIPYANEKAQNVPNADTTPKTRRKASEVPNDVSEERWNYMAE